MLHGDAGSETLLTEFGFVEPRIGERALPVESMYEFGSRVGFWRLHRLFTERAVPVTIFGVAMALQRNPDAVAAMVEADWEIASHGYRWIDYHTVPEAEERAHIEKVIEIQNELTGTRPLGYFLGRRSPNTVRLVAEEGGFLYSQDSYADELPYWVEQAGRRLLMIPYTADHNDHRFATAPGFDWGEPFFAYLRDAFGVLYEEGASLPGMMSIGLHSRLVGRPADSPRSAASSTTCSPTTGSGSAAASTSPATGGAGGTPLRALAPDHGVVHGARRLRQHRAMRCIGFRTAAGGGPESLMPPLRHGRTCSGHPRRARPEGSCAWNVASHPQAEPEEKDARNKSGP